MEKKNPQLYIIAGPNGAGKTTFAKKFLPQYANCNNFVNADLIAGGLSPFSPRSVAIKAGKLLLDEIHNLAYKKLDFAYEGVSQEALSIFSGFIDYYWIPGIFLITPQISLV